MSTSPLPPLPPFDPPSRNLTGVTLAGRYCIERRLGEGGMAHVYFARDLESDSEVAIKVLLPQLESDPASVEGASGYGERGEGHTEEMVLHVDLRESGEE